jgi:hypothetical protein
MKRKDERSKKKKDVKCKNMLILGKSNHKWFLSSCSRGGVHGFRKENKLGVGGYMFVDALSSRSLTRGERYKER